MGRRNKTSPAEDIVNLVSMLPWWGAVVLAVVTYLALHAYSSQPTAVAATPGQVANSMVPIVFKTVASIAQYVLPLLFLVAAVLSWFKAKKGTSNSKTPVHVGAQAKSSGVQNAPECPVCASEMVLRSAKRGSNAGKSFWGCSNYPSCKGTRVAG